MTLPKDSIHGIAVVAHGLNTKPGIMNTITDELSMMGIESYLVKFSGHYPNSIPIEDMAFDQWYQDFLSLYLMASDKAKTNNVPLYFLGYSLGALVGDYMITKSNGKFTFDRQILLAPATATRSSSSMIKAAFIFPNSWKIPSFTPDEYRANKGLPIKAYKILFHYQDYIYEHGFDFLNIPTIIFIDPKDELVSYSKLLEYKDKFDLSNYEIVALSSDMKERKTKYHHLIVNDSTMGKGNWQMFTSKIMKLIDQ